VADTSENPAGTPLATSLRDARPFLSHHLRQRANERVDQNGDALHALARWVENLPAHDLNMARIEGTDALDYGNGALNGGPESELLIDAYESNDAPQQEVWLASYASAVQRYWS
jgi:hypothetical protein